MNIEITPANEKVRKFALLTLAALCILGFVSGLHAGYMG